MRNLPQLVHDIVASEAAKLRASLFDASFTLLLLAMAAITCLVGGVFLWVGVYQSLHRALPAWQAGAIVAVGVIVVAGLIAFWSRRRMLARRAPRPAEAPSSAVSEELRKATEAGIDAGEILSRSGMNPVDLTVAAFLEGLVVGRSARRRPPPPDDRDSD